MNKKLISAAAVFVLGASLAVAAPNDGDGFRGGRHRGAKAEHLARKLNLSDAQRDQMRDIRKRTRIINLSRLLRAPSSRLRRERHTCKGFVVALRAGAELLCYLRQAELCIEAARIQERFRFRGGMLFSRPEESSEF